MAATHSAPVIESPPNPTAAVPSAIIASSTLATAPSQVPVSTAALSFKQMPGCVQCTREYSERQDETKCHRQTSNLERGVFPFNFCKKIKSEEVKKSWRTKGQDFKWFNDVTDRLIGSIIDVVLARMRDSPMAAETARERVTPVTNICATRAACKSLKSGCCVARLHSALCTDAGCFASGWFADNDDPCSSCRLHPDYERSCVYQWRELFESTESAKAPPSACGSHGRDSPSNAKNDDKFSNCKRKSNILDKIEEFFVEKDYPSVLRVGTRNAAIQKSASRGGVIGTSANSSIHSNASFVTADSDFEFDSDDEDDLVSFSPDLFVMPQKIEICSGTDKNSL